ncbi:tRNA (5-methylaminomethyl-2-thiouridine)(34)-methyltransferase MnmD [Altibacter sp.]|uniref:tRNA (5-methylaminomethyl-2-thiouridine)(34)-methyltransferase MnmD n=1 Tax=Altibacter sp. TaxID=2024823 RepID=UPI000C8CC810|nr:tRNA (5-methylaminomethyl-2-thiouridine)(34)-methyltransferase MnmD [Altibacter sp.]MAP54162.1 SAM-dependent methyltransferase [Altibacter sp.]
MKREFLTTADGSVTIHLPEWNEQYHSKHGAIAEAKHVFIRAGLHYFTKAHPDQKTIELLEIGFGTGLNALLTVVEAETLSRTINYTGVEAYPVATSEVEKLNYPALLSVPFSTFQALHETVWEEFFQIEPGFALRKQQKKFSEIDENQRYHLIYFDAFGARVQPELWTASIFSNMYKALKPGGALVTYAAKGSVRRAMQAVGFTVERLAGPPGKREMLRAVR